MKELELFIYSMENQIKLTRFILRELQQRHCSQTSLITECGHYIMYDTYQLYLLYLSLMNSHL
jgi:hypothetical protein